MGERCKEALGLVEGKEVPVYPAQWVEVAEALTDRLRAAAADGRP